MWSLPYSSKPSRGSHNQQNTNTHRENWQVLKPAETVKMVKQRNKSQMKEQENSTERGINEMELSKLLEVQFRVMIMRKLNSMSKDIETMKTNQLEMKNHQAKIKNILERITNRLRKLRIRSAN
uniref:Uncharacterized protein n=1 Tax=Molossus molossus TaxID=27622 RepID=A0A7J8EE77_MOLMO|nr:hypothetical protein HJG59_008869 [Molossus molossus]